MVTKQKFAEERKAIIKANTWLKKILPRTNFNSAIHTVRFSEREFNLEGVDGGGNANSRASNQMTEMHFPNPSARLEIRVLGNGFHCCSYYSDEVIFAFVMAFTTLYVACALGDYSLSIMITKVRTVSWPISYFQFPPKKVKATLLG